MKFLFDMNLTPEWVKVFQSHGIDAAHWVDIGKGNDDDTVIMKYARDNEWCVVTNDLDFGTLLALTHESGPSVIQIRAEILVPGPLTFVLMDAIARFSDVLEGGAILTIDDRKQKIRVLPI